MSLHAKYTHTSGDESHDICLQQHFMLPMLSQHNRSVLASKSKNQLLPLAMEHFNIWSISASWPLGLEEQRVSLECI